MRFYSFYLIIKSTSSNKVIIVLNVILAYLHEVKTIISLLVVFNRSDKSFELVDIEFVSTETVFVKWIDDLFFDKIEKFISIKVHIFCSNQLNC